MLQEGQLFSFSKMLMSSLLEEGIEVSSSYCLQMMQSVGVVADEGHWALGAPGADGSHEPQHDVVASWCSLVVSLWEEVG